MAIPKRPKIYHIVHFDRLPQIISDGFLWCDAEILRRSPKGTVIGMNTIKERRLRDLTLSSFPNLHVGDCVPFYFCPRSIMLYLIFQANHPELSYRGGQEPIVHLEADFYSSVEWANNNRQNWVFTLSNAGAYYFEDRNDLKQLHEINWDAVHSNRWGGSGIAPSIKEGKQAEFLVEHKFPWTLVDRIGVSSARTYKKVINSLSSYTGHRPVVEVIPDWYY